MLILMELVYTSSIMKNKCFSHEVMHKVLPTGVWLRFQEDVGNGEPTSKEDQIEITKALSKLAIANGAKMFAQVFFPLRGGAEWLEVMPD